MAKKSALKLLLGLLLLAQFPVAQADEPFKGFMMPSKNIYCTGYEVDVNEYHFRCDIHSGLKPEPKVGCEELDWTGVYLPITGSAQPNCAGDTNFGEYPVLKYGQKWSWHGIQCQSQRQGLTCKNLEGKGFFLSKERWKRF